MTALVTPDRAPAASTAGVRRKTELSLGVLAQNSGCLENLEILAPCRIVAGTSAIDNSSALELAQ
jgi:hypothetical protein